MQQCDPRLMTPREIVSELASILASGYLRHVKVRRFMIDGGPLPADVAQSEESKELTEKRRIALIVRATEAFIPQGVSAPRNRGDQLADRAFRPACRGAHGAGRDETPDLECFKRDLAQCREQITAVLASRHRPGTVLALKGNKPLELRIHRRHWAALYASDPTFFDAVLADERGWRPLPLEPKTMLVFRHESLMGFSRGSFTFIAPGKPGKL